ncbi:MAG: hypothetical protein ACR2MA_00220 [Egibacteraceae bacterium]
MTIAQVIQWIALPDGAHGDGTTLRLSVFVAPRLRTDEADTLAPFTDFLDWPARLRDPETAFAVELSDPGGAAAPTTAAATVASDPPDSALWQALFDVTTPVRPFTFDDYADRPFVTYSVGAVQNTLRRAYAAAALAAPDALPRTRAAADRDGERPADLVRILSELLGLRGGRLYEGVADGDELDERIAGLLAAARSDAARRRGNPALRGGPLLEPLPSDGSTSRDFERALLFHRRPGEPVDLPADRDAAVAHFAAGVDAHQMFSALGDHPALLRRLGLVFDLDVAADDVPEAFVSAPLTLRVVPTWSTSLDPGQHVDVAPWTAYAHQRVADETFFAAAPRTPNPAAPSDAPPTGLMGLPEDEFSLTQIDVDGAALKVLNLVATVDRVAARATPDEWPLGESGEAGLPTLRTGGLALLHSDRAGDLQQRFGRSLQLNGALEAGVPPVFHAEDLTRGYRLDIRDSTAQRWLSAHERVATYEVADFAPTIDAVRDEGAFQVSLAEPPTPFGGQPDPNAEVYVHEALVSWDGWSLAAARPGKSISADPRAPAEGEPDTQPQRVVNEPLTTMGLSVQTRARAGTLPRLRFGRAYRVRVRTVDLAGNGPTPAEADRHLDLAATDTPVVPATDAFAFLRFEPVPPPALVPRARYGEGQSLLRMVVRSDADRTVDQYTEEFNASELVAGGGHDLYQAHDDRHVAPPKAALQLIELHGCLDDVVGSDGAEPDGARRAALQAAYALAAREAGSLDDPSLPGAEVVELRDDSEPRQRYVVHPEAQLTLPYLPDPLATGAMFFGLPGQPEDKPFHVDVTGPTWHEAMPFLFRLVEGAQPPQWDGATRALTVSLPQAATASFRVASVFGGDLGESGMFQWCLETLPDPSPVIEAAEANRCWLLTPWHNGELVHAVQRPLTQPTFDVLEVQRDRDAINAELFGLVVVHAPSTDKVDLMAAWSESVDDPARPGPERRDAHAAVFALPLAVAATESADIDPHEIPFSLRDRDETALLSFSTVIAGSRGLAAPTAHTFGDTRHRRVAYRIVATTPFREYFPAEWTAQPELLSQTSESVALDVPSSAPPASPDVRVVVPTQGWEIDEPDVRRRRGGGLRVYLGRPWFSSGDGELLGVVLGGSPLSPSSSTYPFVTLLGRDPVRAGAPVELASVAAFRNATTVADRVRLLEVTDLVTVVGFQPVYDARTRRWFCDIDLDTAHAYFPFVRLALVRYQPHALSDCHTSSVILADIVQTLADRTLTIVRDASTPDTVQLSVTGPSYTAIRGPNGVRTDDPALGRVTAVIERRDPAIAEDLLAWRAVNGTEVELARRLDDSIATWTGNVVIGQEGDDGPRRIRVIERDHLAADPETADADGLTGRIVYADAVPL